MRVIDLSRAIYPGMPVYPGTEPPIIEAANSIDRDGFAEKRITMYSHTGTHMDAPAHILLEGRSLDQYPPDSFLGTACVVDVHRFAGSKIPVGFLCDALRSLPEMDYLLFYTGWEQYWGEEAYFHQYPVLEQEAALWLTTHMRLKGVGVDAISVDAADAGALPIHHILLNKEILIVENLMNLSSLPETNFQFVCLPLKYTQADGASVRAVAVLTG